MQPNISKQITNTNKAAGFQRLCFFSMLGMSLF